MTISLGINVQSIKAQRALQQANTELGKSYEKLSSGLRINHASDDPAGLSIADKLSNDARIASTAIRNANDGISITSIADAALSQIGNILTRMSELATQSANGAYSEPQRSALAQEFTSLGSEIERIATTTMFNNINLLSASTNFVLQVGFDSSSLSTITVQGVSGTLASLGLSGAGSSKMSFSIVASSTTASQSAAQNALLAVNAAISSLSSSRGLIGAVESRLTYAISNLTTARENFLSAESRIRDVDVAAETAQLTRLQIVQQAATAILAQANQEPARAMDLLS